MDRIDLHILCRDKQSGLPVFLIHLITFPGSEAMFADLGHFSQLSIKVHYLESSKL